MAHSSARDQPGHDVERNQAFGGFLVAVNREGNPDPAEQEIGLTATGLQKFRRYLLQPVGEPLVDRAGTTPLARHFVEEAKAVSHWNELP